MSGINYRGTNVASHEGRSTNARVHNPSSYWLFEMTDWIVARVYYTNKHYND